MVTILDGSSNEKQLIADNIAELSKLLSIKYRDLLGEDNKEKTIENIIESAVHYYEAIINCMPGNVYWLNSEGVAVGCNKNVLKMFGLKFPYEFNGLSFEEMGALGRWTAEATQSFKKDTFEVFKTGKAKLNVEEPPIPDADGNYIYFLTSRVPLFDSNGVVVAVVGISVDITERKNTEAQLIAITKKAEIANKSKSEFLQNMRHDFRTPFAGILGMANLLYEEEEISEKKAKLNDIIQASRALLDQLNEITDFITLEDGGLSVLEKQFDLHAVVKEVIDSLLPSAKEKQLEFMFSIDNNAPRYIIGDRVRTHRILTNLLANSIKFTKLGHVLLKVELAKKENNLSIIKFIVEDTGIGISDADRDIIFEKFSRLNPSYHGVYPGKGLGLRIVKQFLDELGGEIHQPKSKLNKGSTFIVLIPYKQPLLECAEEELMY